MVSSWKRTQIPCEAISCLTSLGSVSLGMHQIPWRTERYKPIQMGVHRFAVPLLSRTLPSSWSRAQMPCTCMISSLQYLFWHMAIRFSKGKLWGWCLALVQPSSRTRQALKDPYISSSSFYLLYVIRLSVPTEMNPFLTTWQMLLGSAWPFPVFLLLFPTGLQELNSNTSGLHPEVLPARQLSPHVCFNAV